MKRRGLALALVLATAVVVAAAQAQQPRDGRPPVQGTASLSGVVVSADASAAPVRRATVEAGGVALLTDDQGRFSIDRLPAGTYFVVASKAGLLPAAFGSRRPAGPGVGIEVGAGQRVSDVRVKMFRGSVLAGVVMDPTSRPIAGAEVQAFRYGIDPTTGQTLPLPVTIGVAAGITDDKGRYRLFGLEPGDYILSVAGPPAAGPMRSTTGADIRYALQLLQLQPGSPLDPGMRRPPPISSPREGAGIPMYYPSAESIGEAPRITLGVAEERQDIDVVRRRVPAGVVRGNVSGSFAAVRGGGTVYLIDAASPVTLKLPWDKTYGSFTVGGVPPGRYDVIALSDAGGFRGRSEAFVSPGSDVTLSMSLQPGATVTGRLVFRATTGQVADPTLVRLAATGASRADLPFSVPSVRADGTFVWTDVPAGRYRLNVTTQSDLQPGWRARSATIGGVELLDEVFDIAAMNSAEVVITLTDARSEISGTLQAADGTPVNDYSVLVFSADSKFWRPASRRTQVVRPNSTGAYALRDLPEGDYLIVALTDIETGQWNSPDFLAGLAPFGMKVSLADGEKKTLNVRVGG